MSDNTAGSSPVKRKSENTIDDVNDLNTVGNQARPEKAVLEIPNDFSKRVDALNQQREKVIQRLCQASKNAKGLPDFSVEPNKDLLRRLAILMAWLETSPEITPQLKQKTRLDLGLKVMCPNSQYKFPSDIQQRAQQLYNRWEEQRWGEGEVVEEIKDEDTSASSEEEAPQSGKRRKQSTATSRRDSAATDAPKLSILKLPPLNHPIFGVDGIMHGAAMKRGKRLSHVIDPRFTSEKRDFKVYGHNGLELGSWWPLQILALFHGAHGSMQAGISGNVDSGAYSVVISGMYEDLDSDRGDYLYYSGSDSHDNADPNEVKPSSGGTKALQASLRSNRPVRVLRKKGGARWSPTEGIRYDGLYHVVSSDTPKNANGGLYERFKLVRLAGQTPLDEIIRSRPTSQEVRDCDRISQGYREA